MIQTIVFLPLLAAIIAGLFGRALGVRFSQLITTGAVGIAALLSWIIFTQFLSGTTPYTVTISNWITSGSLSLNWALKVDTLTAVMLVVVNSVSSLVHLYSIGYMSEDPHQQRFFSYLSLFTFAMLMLVTADNLVQMFFGWEGVGLASYLLIGFWYYKPSANAAALKAFVVNRVGDFGYSLGIFAIFLVFGSVQFSVIFANAPHMAGKSFEFLGLHVDIMTAICLLLFVGAMGKSAQLGLHTWLPDAMEGPTPVSALIHAATMVTAGVFMLARCSPLFEQAPAALDVVCVVGALTAFFAATVGTSQTDIKRVIAYSTCSQLGYMFFALGVGAYGAAIFHLFTHAFFKALLFLGAGSVIHAMHHEQDMRHYGALRKSIPITFITMLIGTIAITGVPPFAGFYSKDTILEAAFMAHSQVGYFAYGLGAIAATLTSFYSWRLMFLTFFGEARWATSKHIQHAVHDDHHGHDAHDGTAGYHPHESPWVMLIPLILLAIGAAAAGFVFHTHFVGEARAEFWRAAIHPTKHDVLNDIEGIPLFWKWLPTAGMVFGLLMALNSYIWNRAVPKQFTDTFSMMYKFFLNKWYFDELYSVLFIKPALWLGRLFWSADKNIIDGVGPDGVAALVQLTAKRSKLIQTGYVYHYAFATLIGVIALLSWAWPHAGKAIGN